MLEGCVLVEQHFSEIEARMETLAHATQEARADLPSFLPAADCS